MNPMVSSDRLEQRLADAKPTYTKGEAIAEANRCLFCHDAPCINACPTGIDIPNFIHKIATDNVRGSARTILSANLLGYSCARVCPVEVLCVGACVYNDWHRYPPIQIGRLQRYAVESMFERGGATTLLPKAPRAGRSVACVGAGPASLATAGYLALEGVDVTLYERRDAAGGLNRSGVAPYKMHVDGAMAEVDYIRSLGVTFKFAVEVGTDLTPADLLKQHDAVFLGVGLGSDSRLGIPGEDGAGVVGATEWIERLKLEQGYSLDGVANALVIGGGNTAIDAARELAKLGTATVSMVYRRTRQEMPGYAHEMELALHEGVKLVEKAVPASVVRDSSGRVTALLLADGRQLPADLIVLGIGQAKLRRVADAFGLAVNERGALMSDAVTCRTNNPKVWAGGDLTRGGDLVVTAAQDGKRAARSMCEALGVTVRPDSPMRAGHI